jgi:periplasmic protein TonB
MTGGPIHRMEAVASRAERDLGDLSDVAPRPAERDADSSAPPISVTNVVPFVRRREAAAAGPASDIALDPAERPAPHLIAKERRVQIVALLALSIVVHSGLYALFTREPEPMASIGLEAISVEIFVGDNRPAAASTPGQQAQTLPADHPNPNPLEPDTTTANAEETRPTEAKPVEETQRLTQTAATEVAPEQPRTQAAETPPPPRPAETPPAPRATETPPERPEQQEVAVLRAEETPASREQELTAAPEEPVKVTPVEPDRPEPVKTETRPQPKAAPKQETKKKQDTRPKERPGPPARTASTEPNPTGPRQNSVSGAPGSSRSNANYSGLVAAHLMRHKRFPEEARNRGEQGRGTVNFSLDGGGRVTRVSLVRGTGSAILDQEATAMVRRASPFPAPPDGRPLNFTAPVSFRAR